MEYPSPIVLGVHVELTVWVVLILFQDTAVLVIFVLVMETLLLLVVKLLESFLRIAMEMMFGDLVNVLWVTTALKVLNTQ
jgi:hypothetical protein